MIYKKSEDAVSPVIGVMLLLVVTIVIAAVVAVFASGVGTEIEPAPTTVLTITDIHDGGFSVTEEDEWFFDPQFSYNVAGVGTDNGDGTYTVGEHTFKQLDDNSWVTLDGTNPLTTEGWKEWLDEYAYEKIGGIYPVTVTINSISGDTLDLKKLSVKVYNSEGVLVAEKHQNSLSGTIEPGDSKKIVLDELIDTENGVLNVVNSDEKVEVSVLYGEHSLVSKELKVTGEY